MSDIHFGHAMCDEQKFKNDLEEAKRLNADIFIVGDFFDAIFSGDPRYKSSVPAGWLQGTDKPLNKVVDEAEKILKPYASKIKVISLGNHEHTIIKYKTYDPISALIHNLNRDLPKQNQIIHGSYIGFYQYVTKTCEKGMVHTFDILMYHGKGGAAEITRGVMDFQRTASKFNYDLFIAGHNHFRNIDSSAKIGISGKGKPKTWLMKNVRCGTYLNSYSLSEPSIVPFSEMSCHTPNETGCAVVRWRFMGANSNKRLELKAEI